MEENKLDKVTAPGLIYKAASLELQDTNEDELKAINKHTLQPLTAEEVFTFKAVLCDNDVDRRFERFTAKALQDLQKLFVGKPVIKDHARSADNQVARIYRTELVQSGRTVKGGELYTQLVAHCYMVRTASNADLIADIRGGIKKEGSVGCSVSGIVCSICGTDNLKAYCAHFPGRNYAKDGASEACTFALTGGRDAYEYSLVPVPCQRKAGTCKSYTGETVYADDYKSLDPGNSSGEIDHTKTKELELRARLSVARAHSMTNTKED